MQQSASRCNTPSSHPALVQLEWVLCWDAAAVWQAHSECLNAAGHGVGGVHASTCTSTRAGVTNNVKALILADLASSIGTWI